MPIDASKMTTREKAVAMLKLLTENEDAIDQVVEGIEWADETGGVCDVVIDVFKFTPDEAITIKALCPPVEELKG